MRKESRLKRPGYGAVLMDWWAHGDICCQELTFTEGAWKFEASWVQMVFP
ncbi:MAG: hypothetical protein ACI9UK_002466 [Candidatus Krumholzibacteriia bacterium]|jgi:hypothetical protein